jgi:hypothetical protein
MSLAGRTSNDCRSGKAAPRRFGGEVTNDSGERTARGLPRHEEYYESFGVTTAEVYDLNPVLAAMQDARRIYIESEDADLVFSVEVPIPPAAAWKYWVNPVERLRWNCRWFSKKPDRVTRNAQGRVGSGTAMHCNHGPGTWRWEIVDWCPFAHFTVDVTGSRSGK